MLCVPADSKRFLAKAAERGSDLIVLDLEDGVAPSAKMQARAALADAVRMIAVTGVPIYVRVNHVDELLAGDLRASVQSGAAGIVMPKLESAAQVSALDDALTREESLASRPPGQVGIIGLIETPLGLCRTFEIAQASPRLVSLGLGAEDFSAAMGMEPSAQSLGGPAQAVAIAAAAAGLHPIGLPGPVGEFSDIGAYSEVVRHARALGIRGAICIHPAQVTVLNDIMAGSAAEIAQARRVVSAFDAALANGQGAIAVDGRMVDAPIANRARLLLQRAALASVKGERS